VKTPERIALLFRLAASVITVAFVAMLIATYSMAQAAPASRNLCSAAPISCRVWGIAANVTHREALPAR
jgi:hypothetical protein